MNRVEWKLAALVALGTLVSGLCGVAAGWPGAARSMGLTLFLLPPWPGSSTAGDDAAKRPAFDMKLDANSLTFIDQRLVF